MLYCFILLNCIIFAAKQNMMLINNNNKLKLLETKNYVLLCGLTVKEYKILLDCHSFL